MEKIVEIEVQGAGYIRISDSCHHLCGNAVGFSFGVSWGKHGFIGGVIGRQEAKMLALFMLEKCEGVTETEEEEWASIFAAMKQKFEIWKNRSMPNDPHPLL